MENITKRVAIDPRTTRGHRPEKKSRHGHRHTRTARGVLWLAASLFMVASAPLARGAEPDFPSPVAREVSPRGYTLAGTRLWLGGYLNISGTVPESGSASLALGDVGLLARYEVTPSIALFNETDLEDSVTWQEGNGVTRGSRVLLLERLYADWSATPEFTVRVGKFLTPFGLWNVIRRAPLTWTVERPLATQSAFPEHATGLGLLYQTTRHGWSLDATGYGQAQDELVRGASDDSASAMGGGRVAVSHSVGPAYAGLGCSGVSFRNRDSGRWEDAYGADVALTLFDHEIMGEFAYSHLREIDASREWGLYLQDVVPLYGSLYGVTRYEHFEPRQGPVVNGMLVGLNWRPFRYLVLKADYQFTDRPQSDLDRGFLASVVLFF
jgi:hypothetical protein